MQVAISLKHLKLIFFIVLQFTICNCKSQGILLHNAFAHNDYWHKRPLFDALDNGFSHIEADIFLRNKKLIVAHILPRFKKKRTLEDLYLKPLQECISGKNKDIPFPLYPLTLMIDIKSDSNKTYASLNELLQKYKSILSSYDNGKVTTRQLTIIITGNKPYHVIQKQQQRLVFLDEDLMKVSEDTLSTGIYQTASCKYSTLLNWDGNGEMPDQEKTKLCRYVELAHRYNKKVRLWASPESKSVWTELLECGVDLINTDQLVQLRKFLLLQQTTFAKTESK